MPAKQHSARFRKGNKYIGKIMLAQSSSSTILIRESLDYSVNVAQGH